jgi:hypothetical protein
MESGVVVLFPTLRPALRFCGFFLTALQLFAEELSGEERKACE